MLADESIVITAAQQLAQSTIMVRVNAILVALSGSTPVTATVYEPISLVGSAPALVDQYNFYVDPLALSQRPAGKGE